MRVLGLVWLGVPTTEYRAMLHLLRDVMSMTVAFEEPASVELSTERDDRVQLFAADHPYYELLRENAPGPVALLESTTSTRRRPGSRRPASSSSARSAPTRAGRGSRSAPQTAVSTSSPAGDRTAALRARAPTYLACRLIPAPVSADPGIPLVVGSRRARGRIRSADRAEPTSQQHRQHQFDLFSSPRRGHGLHGGRSS
jgi:hypothetical protein